MEKLVERDSATRNPLGAAPALAVQFFLIPLTVVGIAVLVYVGFRSMVAEQRTAQECLIEVRNGTRGGRWLAAMELWDLMGDPKVRADRSLIPQLTAAFDEAKGDDARVRQYLALAISRVDPPLPPDAVKTLLEALNEEDAGARISAICALGASGDPAVAAKLEPLYNSDDAGIRKMVVYSLGALPGDTQIATLTSALHDAEPDVQWNAAIALARHNDHQGVPVVQQMLDRSYVEQKVKRQTRQDQNIDPVADVMISGARAAAVLKDASLRTSLEGLSKQDPSMKVRQAALEALKDMDQGALE
jgi:HEAT repeat protein